MTERSAVTDPTDEAAVRSLKPEGNTGGRMCVRVWFGALQRSCGGSERDPSRFDGAELQGSEHNTRQSHMIKNTFNELLIWGKVDKIE